MEYFIQSGKNKIIAGSMSGTKTKQVGYSWVIRLSFNIIFFFIYSGNNPTGKFASEPERFNIVSGNQKMVSSEGVTGLSSLI